MYKRFLPPPPKPPPMLPQAPMPIIMPSPPVVLKSGVKGIFSFGFIFVVVIFIVVIVLFKQSNCPNLYTEDSVQKLVIRHHRSDGNYPSLIYYNHFDGIRLRHANDDGYRYAKIPKLSGDTLYTIDTKSYDNRTDLFQANIHSVETGKKVPLLTNTNYSIDIYKTCWAGKKIIDVEKSTYHADTDRMFLLMYKDNGGGSVLNAYANGYTYYSMPSLISETKVYKLSKVSDDADPEVTDVLDSEGNVVETVEREMIKLIVEAQDNSTMSGFNNLDTDDIEIIMYKPKTLTTKKNFANKLSVSLKDLLKKMS